MILKLENIISDVVWEVHMIEFYDEWQKSRIIDVYG